MMRPSTASVGLLVAALLMHAAARAEPPDAAAIPERISDVNAAVKRGMELRRAGRDEEALDVFREALARAPASNRIRVHLAASHQALGQWVEAERFLREAMQ